MKKSLPYIIGGALIVVLLTVLIINGKRPSKKLDERITMRQRDKIPYGTAAAKSLLPQLFPSAAIYTDAKGPGLWDDVSMVGDNQAVILCSKEALNADEYEMDRLMSFAARGNYVFIIAKSFSYDAQKTFGFTNLNNSFEEMFSIPEDSLGVKLEKPPFSTNEVFQYPGFKYESYFFSVDSLHTQVLGRNDQGFPNFVKFVRGRGAIFVHTAPLAFSNYFILHKNNIRYFEKVMSVIPADVNRVLWNEYFSVKPASSSNSGDKDGNWLRPLLKIPAFRWGFGILLGLLLLYILLNSRRRQRLIPKYARPRNESLDFVKTMGRLYHERKDHYDIARKMALYFLEHIRTVYKLPTHTLDEEFIRKLQFKSGYSEPELRSLIGFMINLQIGGSVNEHELANFHRQLELFYQNT